MRKLGAEPILFVLFLFASALRILAEPVTETTTPIPAKFEGRLVLSQYNLSGVRESSQTFTWQVFTKIGEDLWTIIVNYTNGSRATYWFDGTNSYQLYDDPTLVENGKPLPTPGTLAPVPYPISAFAEVRILWLAFCSAHFVKEFSGQLPTPWGSAIYDPTVYSFHSRVDTLNGSGLPRTCEFTFDKSRIESARTNAWLLSSPQYPLRKQRTLGLNKYLDGFRGGLYSIQTATNQGGIQFPLVSALQVYRAVLEKDHKSEKPSLFEQYDLEVSSIERFDPSEIARLTAITNALSIGDFRYQDAPNKLFLVKYILTNNNWPSSNDPALLEKLRAQALLRPSWDTGAGSSKRHISVILLIGLLALVSLPLIFRIGRFNDPSQKVQN
jgi:hypothetical protein